MYKRQPYYLTHRAQEIGYHPEVILAGRRINDDIGPYIAERVARLMMRRRFPVVGSRVLVLGLSFKENCPDLRNTKVVDLIAGLAEMSADVDVYDPWANPGDARHEYGLELLAEPPRDGVYDAIVLAVAHRELVDMGSAGIRALGKPNAVFFDVKGAFDKRESDGRL